MSLVVARRTETNVMLFSDTKLSRDVLHNERIIEIIPDAFGTLKAVCIHRSLVVAFAGKVLYAEEAIREASLRPEDVRGILLKHHMRNNQEVEFIIAEYDTEFHLNVVKNGQVIPEHHVAWIGSHRAYHALRGYELGQLEPPENRFNSNTMRVSLGVETGLEDRSLYSKTQDAFEKVILSGIDDTVDGIVIPIAWHWNKFTYMPIGAVHGGDWSPDQAVHNEVNSDSTLLYSATLNFGSPALGSHLIESSECILEEGNSLALYYMHGRVGIYYHRDNHGIPHPIVFRNTDDLGFRYDLLQRFKARCNGFGFGFSLDHYWRRYSQLVKEGHLVEALPRITFAVEKFRKDPNRWKLLQLKGLIALKERKFVEAIRELTKAIHLNDRIPETYLLRGNAYAQLCESNNRETLDRAANDYEQALQLRANYPPAFENLRRLRTLLGALTVEN